MSKFDTSGDFFAPQGYSRVNAGGSHEENPNGGIQVGVDPEGVPNMLEEGEPIYNDYVYSDNIIAEADILKKHNLPDKYAGRLYSEIADLYVDEAAETPLDPIAKKGLNTMLVRLADAQEEQKFIQKQKELEEELANLSPEELDALEAALAEQDMQNAQMQEQQAMPMEAAPEQMMQEQVPVEAPMMEQPMQQPMPQMPVMACGGKIKRYDTGGDLGDDEIYSALKNIEKQKSSQQEINAEIARLRGQLSEARINRFMTGIGAGIGNFFDYINTTPEDRLSYATNRLKGFPSLLKSYAQGNDQSLTPERLIEMKKGLEANVESAKEAVARKQERKDSRSERVRAAKEQVSNAESALRNYVSGVHPSIQAPVNQVQVESPTDTVTTALPSSAPVDTTSMANYDKQILELKKKFNLKKDGGAINRFDDGGFAALVDAMGQYNVSRNRGNVRGFYRIDPNFYRRYGFNSIEDLENSDAYKNFTRYVLANPNNPEVQRYLRALDAGTPGDYDVPRLFDGDKLRDDWADTYIRLRNDQRGGIYHFMGNDLNAFQNLTGNPTGLTPLGNRYTSTLGYRDENNRLHRGINNVYLQPVPLTTPSNTTDARASRFTLLNENPGVLTEGTDASLARAMSRIGNGESGKGSGLDVSVPGANGAVDGNGNPVIGNGTGNTRFPLLSTLPRYAGAVTNGLMGLYNVFQKPDEYTVPHYRPVLPVGRLDLNDPNYNPLDQNMAVNTVLAGSAGTSQGLRNSGLGSSTAAALLAQDYNTGRNIGTAQTQIWDANNQRRNAVLTARNQNASALANFDYGQSRDRANILNQAQLYNMQNDLYRQRLNYNAEAQKYAAIQSQLDSLSQALAGIGTENMAMNMINTDSAYDYGSLPGGINFYKDLLRRKKKSNNEENS